MKSLHPYVWDKDSPHFLPELQAVMVSYADLLNRPALLRRAASDGLHHALNIPHNVQVFLDNGSFSFAAKDSKPFAPSPMENRPHTTIDFGKGGQAEGSVQ